MENLYNKKMLVVYDKKNKEWFEIFLEKQTEHKFYTIFLISQMT